MIRKDDVASWSYSHITYTGKYAATDRGHACGLRNVMKLVIQYFNCLKPDYGSKMADLQSEVIYLVSGCIKHNHSCLMYIYTDR